MNKKYIMIIDAHVHITKTRWNGRGFLEDLEKEMKANKVDKSVVMPFFTSTDFDRDTDEVIKEFPGNEKLILIGSLGMIKFTKNDVKKLDSLMKRKIIHGIKLYPGYEHVYPDDKKLKPIFEICEKNKFPLIIHSGDTFSKNKHARVKFTQPLRIDDIAVDFPKMRIIIAHSGFPWTDDCAEVLSKNENVYADISGLFYDFGNPRYVKLSARKINDVIAYAGADKLLFGTDWPLAAMKDYIDFINNNIDLTKEEKEVLMHGNSEKLFKIE